MGDLLDLVEMVRGGEMTDGYSALALFRCEPYMCQEIESDAP